MSLAAACSIAAESVNLAPVMTRTAVSGGFDQLAGIGELGGWGCSGSVPEPTTQGSGGGWYLSSRVGGLCRPRASRWTVQLLQRPDVRRS